MSAQQQKVFISWSGSEAQIVALALEKYLRVVSDYIVPWVSRTGIEPGTFAMAKIWEQLADTNFGILIVTSRNKEAPWLLFEAGALAKTIAGDDARVVPLLIDLDISDLAGPLPALQAKPANKAGIDELVTSLCKLIGVDPVTVTERLGGAWEKLDAALAESRELLAQEPVEPTRGDSEMLREIVETVRFLAIEMQEMPRSYSDIQLEREVDSRVAMVVLDHLNDRAPGEPYNLDYRPATRLRPASVTVLYPATNAPPGDSQELTLKLLASLTQILGREALVSAIPVPSAWIADLSTDGQDGDDSSNP